MDHLYKKLDTIVPREHPTVWLQDTSGVVVILREQGLPQARSTLREIIAALSPSPLRRQYEGLLDEIRSQQVTPDHVRNLYRRARESKPTVSQSTRDKKRVLALVCLSVIDSDLPTAVKSCMSEMAVCSAVSSTASAPYLIVSGSKARVVRPADEDVHLTDTLKSDVLWSLKLFPRDFLLCKVGDPAVSLGRNHLSKFLAELFEGRAFRLGSLI